MKIAVIGGGPAGLYAALLCKLADPRREITVYEKNARQESFGWGVVFSDETLCNLERADPISHAQICGQMVRWDAIDTTFRGQTIRCHGHGFSGIARIKLLDLLASRCEELGVELCFEHEVQDPLALTQEHALVIAADGIHSPTRSRLAHAFCAQQSSGLTKYIWLGCDRALDAFHFIIKEEQEGIFQAHAYPFSATHSTFIVECDQSSWSKASFDTKPIDQCIKDLQGRFAQELGDARLLSNRSSWRSFQCVRTLNWQHQRLVLIGDAAHSAHFSIGSGTKLAMEDAIALAGVLDKVKQETQPAEIESHLASYQSDRWVEVAKLQKSADTSRRWFENISRYRKLDPLQFTAHLLSRSKRITRNNLKARDPAFVERLDRWFAGSAGLKIPLEKAPPPPMFTPFTVGAVELSNRVVVSPMCQYAAKDGLPGAWHLAHLGALARGGAGLVIAEMSAVCPEGRITPRCTGLYTDAQQAAWSEIIDFARTCSNAKLGIQLGHAGRKGACTLPWQGDHALEAQGWPLIAPSAIAFDKSKARPRAFEERDVKALKAAYVAAAQRADRAGFDLIEIHMAHGYLLGSCLSPLSNHRKDAYGGDLQGRAKLPLEIFDAVRSVWPKQKALSVRISATDWAPGGFSKQDRIVLAQLLKARGCDLLDVSAGQTVAEQAPEYGRMFQTPFADEIRHEVGIPTMAVGAISTWDQVNTIIASGRADLCALGRPHLLDPHFTLRAAKEQGVVLDAWPPQYLAIAPKQKA